MKYTLPMLPYALDALEPKMSRETLEYHHGKHHQAYVDNLNKLLKDSPLADLPLEHIIRDSEGALFNNASQVWNHTFFFEQFSKKCKLEPTGALLEAIEMSFGSFGSMKEQFSQAAISHFGSGWVWLVMNGKELDIAPMSNAYSPVREARGTILTCDVWEHSYYIDYRNSRPNYLSSFWEIIDWSAIEKRYEHLMLMK